MRLYIVRHGQTAWNKEFRFQGSSDIPLDDVGKDQAYRVSKMLAYYKVSKIYASPLIRANTTAQIIQKKVNVPISYDPGLQEVKLGEWEGLTVKEINKEYSKEFLIWENEPTKQVGLGVETYYDLQNRAVNTVENICKKESENLIIVTHGAWMRALLCNVLNISLENRLGFEITNTGLTILERIQIKDDHKFVVLTLNDITHLY